MRGRRAPSRALSCAESTRKGPSWFREFFGYDLGVLSVVDAVTTARICPCDCHKNLPLTERVKGIAAVYHCDDALRGWGYTPVYDVHGDKIWRETQKKNPADYRYVAVRF